ncbi:S-layer homology domain-containing protein [Paenibacillus odorifer]|uniref:S-layer homology domain-containing protein n=1 Tax=Paenibacillus odorifer TaxID=189426 RepID=UPI0015C3BD7D|nr:S-layer homology domain-containing protein [Paenibacillus odorifer]
MRERILTLFMTIAILFTTITPGLVPSAEAAGGTVTKTYTATADTMQLNGQAEYNGIYDNDGDGYLYVGMSNNDGFVNVRNRMAASFNLGAPEGTIVSAELVVTVATVLRVPNHTLYMEARGSAANSLDHSFNGTFPFVDVNSPFSDKFTAKSTAEVPMGTYLQDQSITFNVKSAVDAFTGGSDRTVTFTLNGNEADADSGRFLLYSLEASNAAFRPKLVVTYETGPTNTPPTGSFKIAEGTATSASTVNLSVTGSDPDAGDSVTHMRFANSVANLSAASWLPFSNTATFSLSGGDGAKNIYMQVRDSNNAISASSSQIILLDQTAPTGALIINDGAAWTKSEMVTLKGTYTDGSGSGVEQVRLSNVNGTWQTSWFSIADLNGRSWVLPAGQGVKNVYVQYKDRVGNSSNSTISSTITVDTIAPVITNVVNNIVYNSKVNPLFYEGSGLLNGSPYTSGTDITQDGTYTLIVTDQAGNSATVVFKVDTIAPTVTGIANGVIYNTIKTITFNKGTATLNGAAFVSGAQVSQDGVYTLIVTDTAGNVTTINFEIDTTAPKIKGVSEGGVYKSVTPSFNEGTAQLNGTAYMSGTRIDQDGVYTLVVTDTVGNVTTVNFEIENVAPIVTGVMEGGIYISVVPSFNEGTAQLNGTTYTSGTKIDQDGVYTLVVTDAAGNVTMVKFIIDRTAPTVTGVVYGVSYNTDRTITFNEGTATLNGDPFASGETVSAEGDYTLIVTDAVGNVTTVSFTIHKTGPTVTGVVYGSSYNTDRMITFNTGIATLNGDSFASGSEVSAEGDYTLIVTDAMGNVTTIAFTIDKTVPIISGVTDGSIYNTNQSITFNEGTATLNGDPFASGATVFAEGDYTLVVTDEAGNVTTANFTIDRTNPIITGLTVGISNYTSPLTIGFNEGTATLNGQPFTTGTRVISSGNYTLVVIDEAGNQTIATFTLNISTPESGSGSSSDPSTSSSTSPIPSLGLEIEINGVKQKDLAKETTAVMNGKKVTTVTIDEKKLSRYLDSLPDKPVINIPVHNDSDRVLLLLNGQLITTLNDRNAVILIQTELGSYLLAANRIDWSLVTKRFGSEDALRNMVIQVEITNVPESDIVQLANSIGKARLLSPPIDFNITAAHGGKTIELNKFLSYVERTIVIPNSADDHNKNITGITMTKDGNIVPVPTRMMRENGKTFAVIYSLTNSVYAVIENDKTFADIQNHWAKYDIEQVASKLIVQGVTESSFQPNKQITRAEFTAMLVRALGLHTVDQPTSFTDVNSGQWYYETVSIAEGYGLVTASNNSQYTPNEKLSREEAMVLLGKAMKLAGMDTAISDSEAAQQLSTFKDHHLLDLSARAAAALNVKYGIIIGNQGQLTPNNVITRAEATVILQRLLEAAKLSS